MATKRQLAEQILRIKHGGDLSEDAQMDEREVFINIGQVRARIIKEELVANRKAGNFDISGDHITAFENVLIKEDTNKDLFFSDIPVKYLILPDDQGLYQVSLMKNQSDTFVRIPNGAQGIFSGLQAFQLGGRVGYWVEQDKIFYHNFPDDLKDSKVLLKMVASIEDFDPDEELPIPADKEDELIRLVLELYGVHTETPQDKASDNVK